MPSSSDVYPNGSLRHFRYSSILLDIGARLLKLNFQNYYSGKSLDTYLTEPIIKSKLDAASRSKLLRPEQYASLYPTSGTGGSSDIDKYDITLLAFLTRCLHPTLPTSAKVWTKPLRGDLSIEADVARVRDLKNDKLSHAGNIQLEEAEFEYECKQAELIFTRMAKSIASPDYTPMQVIDAINDKMTHSLVPKPTYTDQTTSVTSSLDSQSVGSSIFKQSVSSSLDIQSVTSSLDRHIYTNTRNEMSTSTTTLEKKRKLSFRVKSAIAPFIFQNKKEEPVNNHVLLPKRLKPKSKSKTPIRQVIYKHCLCGLRPSCCRCSHLSSFTTKDHSHLPHRCFLAGLVHLPNGHTVVSDNTHDVVQVFDSNHDLVSEIEYPQPKAVCAISNNIAAVTLSQSSKVVLLQINGDIEITCCNEISVDCDRLLIDIKHRNGKLFILCDGGDIHIHDLESQNTEIIKIDRALHAKFFDLSADGEEFYLSTNQGIVCIDDFGEKWKYRGKCLTSITDTSGIIFHKGKLLALAWEENKIIELSLSGKWLNDICVGAIQRPWMLSSRNDNVFITQYCSDLDNHVCRDIVTFKY